MAKKELQNIAVKTVTNGYILTVGTVDYMAFSQEQLINIFFAHVAIGKKTFLDHETAEALIEAAATWKEKGDAIEAVATWMSVAKKAQKKEQAATQGIVNANAKVEQLEDRIIELKKENADLRAQIAKHKQLGTMLVGGGHPVIKPEPVEKPDYRIRKIDLTDKPKKRVRKKQTKCQ